MQYTKLILIDEAFGNSHNRIRMIFEGDTETKVERDIQLAACFVMSCIVIIGLARHKTTLFQVNLILVAFIVYICLAFTFGFEKVTQGDAIAYLSVEEDLIKIDVYLGSIPANKEVTVNFTALEIHNNGIFYTDSNGLAMQKRTLKAGNAA